MTGKGKAVAVAVSLMTGVSISVMTSVTSSSAQIQPVVSTPTAFGVSPALRDLSAAQLQPVEPAPALDADGALIHPTGDGSYRGPDAALQSGSQGSGIPPSTHNFEGNDIGDNFGPLSGAPPDTNGDAGPNDYVQIVNQVFSVYDKTTGARTTGPIAINALWESAP